MNNTNNNNNNDQVMTDNSKRICIKYGTVNSPDCIDLFRMVLEGYGTDEDFYQWIRALKRYERTGKLTGVPKSGWHSDNSESDESESDSDDSDSDDSDSDDSDSDVSDSDVSDSDVSDSDVSDSDDSDSDDSDSDVSDSDVSDSDVSDSDVLDSDELKRICRKYGTINDQHCIDLFRMFLEGNGTDEEFYQWIRALKRYEETGILTDVPKSGWSDPVPKSVPNPESLYEADPRLEAIDRRLEELYNSEILMEMTLNEPNDEVRPAFDDDDDDDDDDDYVDRNDDYDYDYDMRYDPCDN
jgi:hypothetical protein